MNDYVLQILNMWFLSPIFMFLRLILIFAVLTILHRLLVSQKKKQKVAVIVLGDIGRSPRMQYHALSLAQHNINVTLAGYSGSLPHQSILDNQNIKLCFIKESFIFKGGKVLCYFLKVMLNSLHLLSAFLFNVGATEFILVQNPPCIPSLAICWIISLWNGSRLIVDWHNYGYSILSLTMEKSHILVKIAHKYEEIFGQLSHRHLCVTHAMARDMMERWNISAEVMHDRPAAIFKPISIKEKHKLFEKLALEYPAFASRISSPSSTRFSKMKDDEVELLQQRPALLVSSTSWTEDEDFSILLEALEGYEKKILDNEFDLPDIVCAITGKGPLKTYYQNIISAKHWKHIDVITPWLEAEDYPKLLACADLGVSLHTSSSGLDLPMKVVDMFGSGLPVAAINFSCLDELVQHDVNGLVFDDAPMLTDQLVLVFTGFPKQKQLLDRMCEQVEKFREVTWDISWNKIVLPIFKN